MWSRRKTRLDRIACAALAFLFAVMNIINPLVIMPAYADANDMVRLAYQYEEKPEVEILVRSNNAAILPGEEMALHITVRNNTESVLPHGILTWEDKTDAFSDAEFVLIGSEDSAELMEDGSVEGIFVELGETYEIAFHGTLREDLKNLRKETLGFTFEAVKADGSSVEAEEEFRYQAGFASLAPVEFSDGNELAAGETGSMTLQLNMEEVELATASNSNTATDSDAEAFLTPDRVTYTLETFGVKLKKAAAKETTANGTAISTDVEFEVAEDTEPGVYFGKVTAEVKVGSKNYTLTQGFAVEVVEETGARPGAAGHLETCVEGCTGEGCNCKCHARAKELIAKSESILAEAQTFTEKTDSKVMLAAYEALSTLPDEIELALSSGDITEAEYGYVQSTVNANAEAIIQLLLAAGFNPYAAQTLGIVEGDPVNAKVTMFDYDESVNEDSNEKIKKLFFCQYDNLASKDGLGVREKWTPTMDNKLNDGYPAVRNVTGPTSMKYLFDETYQEGMTMEDGGGLFQQDDDGYYYYDSGLNAAKFDCENKFTLYDYVVRPDYTDYQNGNAKDPYNNDKEALNNFFPFNDPEKIIDWSGKQTYNNIDSYIMSRIVYCINTGL